MSRYPGIGIEEARVLGCLIEKQITTPEYYPLTLNALVLACNQKNNRYPVVFFDEEIVRFALDVLRQQKLVAMVSEAGARATKYKHYAPAVLGIDEAETAVLCELLLRGPQTPGELRTRAERMYSFPDLNQVQQILDRLSSPAEDSLVVKLPLVPGTKESRYMHTLCGPPAQTFAEGEIPAAEPRGEQRTNRLTTLETEVSLLKSQLQELRQEFDSFRRQLE